MNYHLGIWNTGKKREKERSDDHPVSTPTQYPQGPQTNHPLINGVKRERSSTPPPSQSFSATPARQFKIRRVDHYSPPKRRLSSSTSLPPSASHTTDTVDSLPCLSVKVEPGIVDLSPTPKSENVLEEQQTDDNVDLTSSLAPTPTTFAVKSETQPTHNSHDATNSTHNHHIAGENSTQLSATTGFHTKPLDAVPAHHSDNKAFHSITRNVQTGNSNSNTLSVSQVDHRTIRTHNNVYVSTRNQQNRTQRQPQINSGPRTRTPRIIIDNRLGSRKRVLNPETLSEVPIGVLQYSFHKHRIDETLFCDEVQEELDELDEDSEKDREIRGVIEFKAVIEMGLRVLSDSMASLSMNYGGYKGLLEDYRFLMTSNDGKGNGRWDGKSVIEETLERIKKLGGTVCNDEIEFLRVSSRKYIHIVGISPLEIERIDNPRIEVWNLHRCIGTLIKVCNDRIEEKTPLEEKLRKLAGWCMKDRRETGLDKVILVSPFIDEKYITHIKQIVDYERFLLCETPESFAEYHHKERIHIQALSPTYTSFNTNSNDVTRSQRPQLMKMSPEDFYKYVSGMRKRKGKLSTRPGLVRGLPPRIETGSRSD